MTRKEKERLFRRQQIIDASVKLFASKGFNLTTLDEIATSSEFGKGTIYNYFKSKEEIYSAIVEDVSQNLKKIIQIADKEAGSASDFVKLYTAGLFNYCFANKEAFKLFVREIVPFTTDLFFLNREKLLRRHSALKSILIKQFTNGIKNEEFKKCDAENLINLYRHLVFPYILYLIESNKKELDEDAEIEFVLEIFFKGILLKNKR